MLVEYVHPQVKDLDRQRTRSRTVWVLGFLVSLSLLFPSVVFSLPRPKVKAKQVGERTVEVTVRMKRKKRLRRAKLALQVSLNGSHFHEFANFRGRRAARKLRFTSDSYGLHMFRAQASTPDGDSSAWSKVKAITLDAPAGHVPPPLPAPPEPELTWPELTTGLSECPAGAEDVILAEVNRIRREHGVALLAVDYRLQVAARWHSIRMAEEQRMTHDGWFEEIMASGFLGNHFSQNIAMYIQDPEVLVDAWMSSAYHERNILNPNDEFTGVSCVRAADGKFYWTQNFGG